MLAAFLVTPFLSQAQIDEDQMGAWYMYFYNAKFGDGPWGMQGDIQHRNWEIGGDLEQLLIRSGLTYRPKNANVMLTFGYANITTGEFGESSETVNESRIYQEVLYPAKIGTRIYLNHRIRYEQRWVDNQDLGTRYRFNLFMNIPFNSTEFDDGTFYLALYNEVFILGRSDGESAESRFDRNRFYTGVGYVINNNLRVQAGHMSQATANWTKRQLQFSLHHTF